MSASGISTHGTGDPRWPEMLLEAVYCDSCGEDLP